MNHGPWDASFRMVRLLNPAREANESYDAYRARRKFAAQQVEARQRNGLRASPPANPYQRAARRALEESKL